MLLVIDQFEEVATLATPDERNRFMSALRVLLSPALRTAAIFTLRTADLPRISELLEVPSEHRLLAPFQLDRLPEIVRKPAEAVGLLIDDALVAAIQRDTTSADALPLVAYLLRRLHDSRTVHARLTRAEYDKLGDPRNGLSPIEACIRDAADDAISDASRQMLNTALREAASCVEQTLPLRAVHRLRLGDMRWELVSDTDEFRMFPDQSCADRGSGSLCWRPWSISVPHALPPEGEENDVFKLYASGVRFTFLNMYSSLRVKVEGTLPRVLLDKVLEEIVENLNRGSAVWEFYEVNPDSEW